MKSPIERELGFAKEIADEWFGGMDKLKKQSKAYVDFCNEHHREPTDEEMKEIEKKAQE